MQEKYEVNNIHITSLRKILFAIGLLQILETAYAYVYLNEIEHFYNKLNYINILLSRTTYICIVVK